MLEPQTLEELNAKCNCCSSGLSVLETILYGNRCVFCYEHKIKTLSLWKLLWTVYYDWQIYNLSLRAIKEKGREDGRFSITAYIGVVGYEDINQVNTIPKKKRVIKYIKRALRGED